MSRQFLCAVGLVMALSQVVLLPLLQVQCARVRGNKKGKQGRGEEKEMEDSGAAGRKGRSLDLTILRIKGNSTGDEGVVILGCVAQTFAMVLYGLTPSAHPNYMYFILIGKFINASLYLILT